MLLKGAYSRSRRTAKLPRHTGDARCPHHDEHTGDYVSGMVGVAKEESEKRCWQTEPINSTDTGCHQNGSAEQKSGST
jgi:hypothetical protein